MSQPERMAAIRRLYLVQLEKAPADMSQDMRRDMAKKELDKILGLGWRDEIKDAGHGLDPIGMDSQAMEDRLDKLPMATREAGYHGDDVPPPEKKKEKVDASSILEQLMAFFHR